MIRSLYLSRLKNISERVTFFVSVLFYKKKSENPLNNFPQQFFLQCTFRYIPCVWERIGKSAFQSYTQSDYSKFAGGVTSWDDEC